MISAIIPTLNAKNSIKQLLSSLRNQSISSEMIVIDSESADGTAGLAESCGAKVIRIKREDFDHGGTRNLGVNQARGDIVVFMTQDALPADSRCLENLTRPFNAPGIAASFGRQIPGPGAKPVEKFARCFNYPDTPVLKGREDIKRLGIKTFFLSNACSAFRKKEFLESGGFPERTIVNEDMLLVARLVMKGYKIAYAPEARVFHSHNYTLVQQLKRYFDIGAALSGNPWILEHAKVNDEGVRFLAEEINYLMRNGNFIWIPYAVGETIFKYLGYKTGLNYRFIPNAIRKKISMHSYHWNRPHPSSSSCDHPVKKC